MQQSHASYQQRMIPEVNTLQAVNCLLQLLRWVEGLQAIGCNNLLQLAHQALLSTSVVAACSACTKSQSHKFLSLVVVIVKVMMKMTTDCCFVSYAIHVGRQLCYGEQEFKW